MLAYNETKKIMWVKGDDDGCAGEEKERRTEVEVDGQHKGRLETKD